MYLRPVRSTLTQAVHQVVNSARSRFNRVCKVAAQPPFVEVRFWPIAEGQIFRVV